jgi:D-alanyl-D-alanine carboxypeptidase
MTCTTRRRPGLRATLAAVVLVVALGLGLAACTTTESGIHLPRGIPSLASSSDGDAHGLDDGYIPAGGSVSPFADDLPAIANLEPELRAAMQAAATAAIADGFEFVVTSGWRSAAYQQSLLDDATVTYGSLDEAREWVTTPDRSTHVTGNAVDIGYTDADSWLSQHGSDYGLCQIYTNEMWHFELATTHGGDCPVQKTDAAG